jgi:chromate transport protein ChrA
MSHASCTDAAPEGAALVRPSLPALFLGFLKLGLTAFGGPAMIPYIRRYAVENKGWIDEKRFKTGVGLSQAIPGATAMQVAAYVGIVARGLPGGLAATAACFALATNWRAEAAFLALVTFAALRVGVGLMWVVLGGSGLAWLLLR